MIAVRRASERQTTGSPAYRWSTFDPHAEHPSLRNVGALELLDEERLGPPARAGADRDPERLTYVVSGALTSPPNDRFRRFVELAPPPGAASNPRSVRVLQLGFRGGHQGQGLSRSSQVVTHEERADCWHLALSLGTDARIFTSSLSAGRRLEVRLDGSHAAWLQVVSGQVTLDDVSLAAGDGVLVKGVPSASIAAQGQSELLLIEVVDEHEELLWNGD